MTADFPPRTWTRGIWKWWYRQTRISRRETDKAFMDTVLFGCGFTRVSPRRITHVPYHAAVDMGLTPTMKNDGFTYE